MAVFPDLPGLEAKVVVNGIVCEEHSIPNDVSEDGSSFVTKYIEATPGAKFEVHVAIRSETLALRNNDMCVWVKVDGQIVLKPVWRKGQGISKARVVQGLGEQSSMGWIRRDLVFSGIKTDDNYNRTINKEFKQRIDKLGQITMEFYRVKVGQQVEAKAFEWSNGDETLPEKALKGRSLSHKIGLSSTSIPITTPHRLSSEYLDDLDNPYATICFRYRSLRDLKAEMIVPRSPSPVPLDRRPIEELSREEMIELLKTKEEHAVRIQQENIRIKRERASPPSSIHEDNEDLSVVEPTPKRRRVTETIDLTGD
ncbi:ATP-dependent RNA helicase [Venturia nashicola]|nr:ATP-dependent RNA helicase [Venturia nashicola]